jgi:hypothetical protein
VIQAVYPGIWASHQSGGGGGDPFFSDVVNLSHFDGANGSQTFVDSSSHSTNLNNGGQTNGLISTAQSVFGGASMYMPAGSSAGGDNVQNFYKVGTNDFTIEWWARPDSIAAAQNMVFFDGGSNSGFYYNATSGTVVAYLQTVGEITSTAGLAAATWTFIAYSRIGTSGVLYMGGVNQGSWVDNLNYTGDNLWVGSTGIQVNSFQGYIDDFRFTIGKGRYSGPTCPVPTSAFPNHS